MAHKTTTPGRSLQNAPYHVVLTDKQTGKWYFYCQLKQDWRAANSLPLEGGKGAKQKQTHHRFGLLFHFFFFVGRLLKRTKLKAPKIVSVHTRQTHAR
jgi:hypothetical protein